jgi:hypothetical protein
VVNEFATKEHRSGLILRKVLYSRFETNDQFDDNIESSFNGKVRHPFRITDVIDVGASGHSKGIFCHELASYHADIKPVRISKKS